MLVKRDNTIDYHVINISLDWNDPPDKTSCWPTAFIKSADYLFLTDSSDEEASSDDDQVPEGNI